MTLPRREVLAVLGGVSTVTLRRFFAEFDWLEVGEMDIDEMDVDSLRTDEQSISGGEVQCALNGLVVPVADGLGTSDAVDPSNTTTPVQDAMDLIKSASMNAGSVLLPPQPVQEAASLDVPDGGTITVHGVAPSGSGSHSAGEIEFTSSGSTSDHGIILSDFNDDFGLYNVSIKGPGSGTTSGNGLRFTGPTRGLRMDNVVFKDWGADPINTNGFGTFDWSCGKVECWNNSGGLFLDNLGPGCNIDQLRTSGGAFVLDQRSGTLNIGTLNVGGDVGAGGPNSEAIRTHGGLTVEHVNFEPTSFGGTGVVYHKFSGRPVIIGGIANWATVDYVYRLDSAGAGRYGPVDNTNGTINNSVLQIRTQPADYCWYDGESADITNTAGTATGLVRSLATAGTGNG